MSDGFALDSGATPYRKTILDIARSLSRCALPASSKSMAVLSGDCTAQRAVLGAACVPHRKKDAILCTVFNATDALRVVQLRRDLGMKRIEQAVIRS